MICIFSIRLKYAWCVAVIGSASDILRKHGLKPLQLQAKEGLALINGTQFMTALGCEALVRAENCVATADVVSAMSLEALKGSVRAYTAAIHKARPHAGQSLSAFTLRAMLHSTIHPR